jgi:hypothetical protein
MNASLAFPHADAVLDGAHFLFEIRAEECVAPIVVHRDEPQVLLLSHGRRHSRSRAGALQ